MSGRSAPAVPGGVGNGGALRPDDHSWSCAIKI